MTIKAPGGIDGFFYDNMPSGSRDFTFKVDVASTSGWGEINIIMRGVSGHPEWTLAVDPVAQKWSLYRTSTEANELFYWVEPRPLAALAPGPVRSVEVRIRRGMPTMYVNGTDVVTPFGIAMPEITGSLVMGFGAGINPYSLTGYGDAFTAIFARAELAEL